jgi:hypothetical protein
VGVLLGAISHQVLSKVTCLDALQALFDIRVLLVPLGLVLSCLCIVIDLFEDGDHINDHAYFRSELFALSPLLLDHLFDVTLMEIVEEGLDISFLT